MNGPPWWKFPSYPDVLGMQGGTAEGRVDDVGVAVREVFFGGAGDCPAVVVELVIFLVKSPRCCSPLEWVRMLLLLMNVCIS